MPIVIRAADAACALGNTLDHAAAAFQENGCGLREETVPESWGLPRPRLLTGRIPDRALIEGRRYGAVGNLMARLAGRALNQAGLSETERAECPLFAASSRGSSRSLNEAVSERRRVPAYAASNSLAAEAASAVSIECGLRAGHFLLSNGCSSGLDALAMAWRHLHGGFSKRALVVAADLPVTKEIVGDFHRSGLLALEPDQPGIHLAEGGVAVLLECRETASRGEPVIEACAHRADAWNHLAQPMDGGALIPLLRTIAPPSGTPFHLSPHATGTANNAAAEQAAFSALEGEYQFTRHPMKPALGHTLGASGLLELALATRLGIRGTWIKLATAMGGNHTAVRFRIT